MYGHRYLVGAATANCKLTYFSWLVIQSLAPTTLLLDRSSNFPGCVQVASAKQRCAVVGLEFPWSGESPSPWRASLEFQPRGEDAQLQLGPGLLLQALRPCFNEKLVFQFLEAASETASGPIARSIQGQPKLFHTSFRSISTRSRILDIA